jgi:hypothetical protein
MVRVWSAAALAAAAVLALAGCSSKSTRAGLTCPPVQGAPGADTIVFFGPGGHEAKDVTAGARFFKLDATCAREKVGVAVNATITFYVQRETALTKGVQLPYFVALVDPSQHLLNEEAFQTKIAFTGADAYTESSPERITVHIPVKNDSEASAFTVVVGFQLTADQLAFNRSTRPQ